jgi:hypothetical protein
LASSESPSSPDTKSRVPCGIVHTPLNGSLGSVPSRHLLCLWRVGLLVPVTQGFGSFSGAKTPVDTVLRIRNVARVGIGIGVAEETCVLTLRRLAIRLGWVHQISMWHVLAQGNGSITYRILRAQANLYSPHVLVPVKVDRTELCCV